jgi:hypothetical protein
LDAGPACDWFRGDKSEKLKGSKAYVIAFSVWGTLVAVKVLWVFVTS